MRTTLMPYFKSTDNEEKFWKMMRVLKHCKDRQYITSIYIFANMDKDFMPCISEYIIDWSDIYSENGIRSECSSSEAHLIDLAFNLFSGGSHFPYKNAEDINQEDYYVDNIFSNLDPQNFKIALCAVALAHKHLNLFEEIARDLVTKMANMKNYHN